MTRNDARDVCATYFHIVTHPPMENRDGIDPCHLSWMLKEIWLNSQGWPDDKFWRWVGYVQALMVIHGFRTLDKIREDMR